MKQKLRTWVSALLITVLIVQPAMAHDPVMEALLGLQQKVAGTHQRLDGIEAVLGSLEARVAACVHNQESMDALITELAAGDQQLAADLQAVCAEMRALAYKLDSCGSQMERAACELQNANCWLEKANCILCKLPGNIRKAKIRAFIVGFAAGMGLSGGLGGAGGLSASIW